MQKMRENLHQQFVLKKDNKIFFKDLFQEMNQKKILTLKQKVALSMTTIF